MADPAKVVAGIEARMSATRFPGKVLKEINGVPALSFLLKRLRRSHLVDEIILATTTNKADEALIEWAQSENVPCYRGSESDVLGRVLEAHRSVGSDVVVEICGDCPFTDPEIIDQGVATFFANNCDVVSTTHVPSYADGLDVQVFKFSDLATAADETNDLLDREHVSLHFYRHPEKYRIFNMIAPASLQASEYRFLLDYPQDLEFLGDVARRLADLYGDGFTAGHLTALLQSDPDLAELARKDRWS